MKKLLIVEDDLFLNKVYKKKLVDAGYEIETLPTGTGVIESLTKSRPDAILLDLIMPEVDGFQVLETLKDKPELASIPVIVLSNLGQDADVKKAKDLGAREYLVKSNVTFEKVLETIQAVTG